MAVKRIDSNYTDGNTTVYNEKLEFQGLSTDTKPTLIESQSGSTYLAVDTGQVSVWHINAWYGL